MWLHTNSKELAEALTEFTGWVLDKETLVSLNYLKLFSEPQQAYMTVLLNKYQQADEEAGKKLLSMLDSKRGEKKHYINNKLKNKSMNKQEDVFTNYPNPMPDCDIRNLDSEADA